MLSLTLSVFFVGLANARLPEHQPLTHAELRSSNGAKIEFHYSLFDEKAPVGCHSCNSIRYASPLTIKIKNLRLGEITKAILIVKRDVHQEEIFVKEIYLNFDEREYFWVGSFPMTEIAEYGPQGNHVYHLELAVLSGDEWLVEPLSQTHNFQFKLDH